MPSSNGAEHVHCRSMPTYEDGSRRQGSLPTIVRTLKCNSPETTLELSLHDHEVASENEQI